MTQLFIFNEQGKVQLSEARERPEVIVQIINRGEWERFLPYESSPTKAWQAIRVHSLVIILPLTTPDNYPQIQLTPREFQTLQGLCAGNNADQIAYQLHVQPRSVRRYSNNLRAKFKSRSLPEVLAKAAALDLVRPDLDALFD